MTTRKSYEMRGLDPQPFAALFNQSDEALKRIGIRRVHADEADSYPCRISLRDAAIGEELLLVNHTHQGDPSSPYRATGPIFVGRAAEPALHRDELPPILRRRLLSLRAYDAAALMVDAEVVQGETAPALIERFLARPDVAWIDAHFARQGCFAARVARA